jgi:tRNA (guanine37-N1)-methyltransferase
MYPDELNLDFLYQKDILKQVFIIVRTMRIHFVSLFPEIFDSFLSTSIIKKAQEKKLLEFSLINPRNFCTDKHQQVDDTVYGGGDGMLIKAQPMIDAVEDIVSTIE